jgi:hypothetical protein
VFLVVGSLLSSPSAASVRDDVTLRGRLGLMNAYDPDRLRALDYAAMARLDPPALLRASVLAIHPPPGDEIDGRGRVAGRWRCPWPLRRACVVPRPAATRGRRPRAVRPARRRAGACARAATQPGDPRLRPARSDWRMARSVRSFERPRSARGTDCTHFDRVQEPPGQRSAACD